MPNTPKTRSTGSSSETREKLESVAYSCSKLGKQLLFTISFKEISDEVPEDQRQNVQDILDKLVANPAKYVPLVLKAPNVNTWTKVLSDDLEAPAEEMSIKGF